MARDDEVDEGTSFDPTFATAGPRRSTFTPPPGSPAYTAPTEIPTGAVGDDEHDDDELAQALAADLGRIASGAISIPDARTTNELGGARDNVSGEGADGQIEGTLGAVSERAADTAPGIPASWLDGVLPNGAPADDEQAAAPPPGARETTPRGELSDAPPPPSGALPADHVPPPAAPWSSLPAPDPADAVDLPGAPPRPPQRRSLTDSELLALANGGDAGQRIEQLQEQLRLRESEAREFSTWEARMLALGTPDAFTAVRDARAQFSDVVGAPTTPGTGAIPVLGTTHGGEQPVAAGQPEAAAPPTISETPPASEQQEPVGEPETAASPVGAEPVREPESVERPLPAWDVPPPSATWSPGPDPDDDIGVVPSAVVPDVVGVSSDDLDETSSAASPVEPAVYDAEIAPPAALSHESAAPESPDDADVTGGDPTADTMSVFAPPALVEPPPFGGPALLPSEAAATPPPLVDSVPVFVTQESVDDMDAEDSVVPESGDAVSAASQVPELVLPGTLLLQPEIDSAEEPASLEDRANPESALDVELDPDEASTVVGDDEFVEADVLQAEIVEPDLVEPESVGTAAGVGVVAGATAASSSAPEFSFDDLIAGLPEGVDEEPARDESSDGGGPFGGAESLFIEPLPVAAGEPVPLETGSVVIVEPAYEEETDDVVAETDRVAYVGGEPTGPVILPPSGPIATARVADDENVLQDDEPVAPPAFVVEAVGPEPTPLDRRVGTAARLFWLWFAANASVISLGLGAAVFAIGMSLRQSIVAILVGVALSFIPLGLTTLAGKRSGQPTMVVSRASFGHRGNVLPAAIAVVTRVFWGAVMLWLAASAVAVVLVGAGLDGGLPESVILIASLAVLFAVAFVVAIFGYGLFARLQLVLSMLSAVLVMGFIVLTAGYIDVAAALTIADASWLRAIGGAVLVFSVVGLVWAHSGSDLARYQRPESSGAGSMLWATFGAGLPAFLLVAYGALLAASNERIAEGFLTSPLDTLALMLPSWYPVPLIAATVLSLLSGVVITIYSGGFAVQALGVRVARPWAVLVVALLLGGVTLAVGFALPGGLTSVVRDAATTLAVPTAAWAGIITAETMIRNRRFESGSLVSRGGVYGDWRWGNLIGFVLISALGFGLTTAQVSWLSWQGYVLDFFAVPRDSDLAATDLGVLVALALGILLPIVVGIPAIRRQEETRL